MNILISAGDHLCRNQLKMFLMDSYHLEISDNGQDLTDEFISSWEDGLPYQMIFVDNELSDMKGIDSVRKIREIESIKKIPKTKRAKIILLTPDIDKNLIKESINAGCDSLLIKPLTIERVFNSIEKMNMP